MGGQSQQPPSQPYPYPPPQPPQYPYSSPPAPPPPKRGLSTPVKVILIVVVVLIVLVAIGAALSGLQRPANQPPAKVVTAGPAQVIITVSDIPETGWQLTTTGSNASAAWREFMKPGQFVTVIFNLTMWVQPNASAATAKMNAIVSNLSYSSQDGGVSGADASVYWSYNAGYQAVMVVRRYNVVFLIDAVSDNSLSVTSYDLGTWAGWQLPKVESLAH